MPIGYEPEWGRIPKYVVFSLYLKGKGKKKTYEILPNILAIPVGNYIWRKLLYNNSFKAKYYQRLYCEYNAGCLVALMDVVANCLFKDNMVKLQV